MFLPVHANLDLEDIHAKTTNGLARYNFYTMASLLLRLLLHAPPPFPPSSASVGSFKFYHTMV